ncbi:hypothetical protein QI155_10815 [Thermodesulfovibrio sp. 1176]|uniref:hypothetical protein n=1 Tax=Thermodesulfovibrio sp. 1176 TaxID=3043424 RepID=UPI0024821E8F|nr:hypothetical protein [Thermodesulfovibrio sp. 1176]MDI1473023.1 hypothetical protein [Thermodesulfovibrio sp. 1176]
MSELVKKIIEMERKKDKAFMIFDPKANLDNIPEPKGMSWLQSKLMKEYVKKGIKKIRIIDIVPSKIKEIYYTIGSKRKT